jgi:hypothetical protein
MADSPSGKWIVALTSFLTLSPALATAVHGWISKSRELQLARSDQEFKTRSWFLEKAVDAHRAPEERQQILRFIAGSPSDANLQAWASRELTLLNPVQLLHKKKWVAGIRNFMFSKMADDGRMRLNPSSRTYQDDLKAVESFEKKAKEAAEESAGIQSQLIEIGGVDPLEKGRMPYFVEDPYSPGNPAELEEIRKQFERASDHRQRARDGGTPARPRR